MLIAVIVVDAVDVVVDGDVVVVLTGSRSIGGVVLVALRSSQDQVGRSVVRIIVDST